MTLARRGFSPPGGVPDSDKIKRFLKSFNCYPCLRLEVSVFSVIFRKNNLKIFYENSVDQSRLATRESKNFRLKNIFSFKNII